MTRRGGAAPCSAFPPVQLSSNEATLKHRCYIIPITAQHRRLKNLRDFLHIYSHFLSLCLHICVLAALVYILVYKRRTRRRKEMRESISERRVQVEVQSTHVSLPLWTSVRPSVRAREFNVHAKQTAAAAAARNGCQLSVIYGPGPLKPIL